MLNRLNHIAIAVPNLDEAVKTYSNAFGVKISEKKKMLDHGVTTIFIKLSNTNIELIEPLGNTSPIKKFLTKNPTGGIHHLCYEVENIIKSVGELKKKGYKILGDGIPKKGAHGKLVVFLHPKEFNGTLIELEEI